MREICAARPLGTHDRFQLDEQCRYEAQRDGHHQGKLLGRHVQCPQRTCKPCETVRERHGRGGQREQRPREHENHEPKAQVRGLFETTPGHVEWAELGKRGTGREQDLREEGDGDQPDHRLQRPPEPREGHTTERQTSSRGDGVDGKGDERVARKQRDGEDGDRDDLRARI